ncbi:hypothetical protein [Christiangramia salexigens]|uniref:UspA domain-containing protein n=1 Tax=Christiangramia salexigens TaxID=1913577 RepID=A0A1L3J185_9FLAO|nr:hypothetical protein [Christiangramia salexigens]APG58888.1 hypothetical protein LPB144_00010 [Christiangramia salexigens]
MNSFNNILVALDLSEMDTTLIRYASFISEKLGADKVYFVHNIKKYEISELFEEQLKDINLDKIISEEIDEKVSENFSSNCKWRCLFQKILIQNP